MVNSHLLRRLSSVVEHFHGKEGVSSSNLEGGSKFITMKRFIRPNPKPSDLETRRSEVKTRLRTSILGTAALAGSIAIQTQTEALTAPHDTTTITGILGAFAIGLPIITELMERYGRRGGGWGKDRLHPDDPNPDPDKALFVPEGMIDWDQEFIKILQENKYPLTVKVL